MSRFEDLEEGGRSAASILISVLMTSILVGLNLKLWMWVLS